jgi:hypothetical protein
MLDLDKYIIDLETMDISTDREFRLRFRQKQNKLYEDFREDLALEYGVGHHIVQWAWDNFHSYGLSDVKDAVEDLAQAIKYDISDLLAQNITLDLKPELPEGIEECTISWYILYALRESGVKIGNESVVVINRVLRHSLL